MFSVVALSIDSAALALQVPHRVIAEAIKSAELPAYAGPGKRVRITVADLTEWMARTWPRTTLSKRSRQ
jgi:excisionase family DNA binding protein